MTSKKLYSKGEIRRLIMDGIEMDFGQKFIRWGDGNGTFIVRKETFDESLSKMQDQSLGDDPEVRANDLFFEGMKGKWAQVFEDDCDRDVDEVGAKFPNI
jgi:hypothetical protein